MSYSLEFHVDALAEWRELRPEHRERFKAKLKERLENPVVAASRLSGASHRYKIKFKSPPLRLVYEVLESEKRVRVLAIGPRARLKVYKAAEKRS